MLSHPHGKILVDRLSDFRVTMVYSQLWLTNTEANSVAWISKEKSITTEDYVRQCLAGAQSKGVPLALRQGGGSDIGFVAPNRSRSWKFSGVPKFFGFLEVLNIFLRETVGVNPPLKKINEVAILWLFRAKAATPQSV